MFPSSILHYQPHESRGRNLHESMQITSPANGNHQQWKAVKKGKESDKSKIAVPLEYLVSWTRQCVDTSQWRRYAVIWYNYGPEDDVPELPHHIPTQLYLAILESSNKQTSTQKAQISQRTTTWRANNYSSQAKYNTKTRQLKGINV